MQDFDLPFFFHKLPSCHFLLAADLYIITSSTSTSSNTYLRFDCRDWSGVSLSSAHVVFLRFFPFFFFRVLVIDNFHAQQRILVHVKTKRSIN